MIMNIIDLIVNNSFGDSLFVDLLADRYFIYL